MDADDHRSLHAPVAAATLGLALAGYLTPALAGAVSALRRPLGIEDRTWSGRGCGLTFDDGPHPKGTAAVLEILAREDLKATFFVVGEQVRRDPRLLDEVLSAGHEVGLHCDRHTNLLAMTPRQTSEDLLRGRATIEDRTGLKVRLYRPPYGILNWTALRWSRREGLRTVLWTQWGRDWEAGATGESIASLLTDGIGDGSVLLLHDADDYSSVDSWKATVQALPSVLATLAERGLEVVDLIQPALRTPATSARP